MLACKELLDIIMSPQVVKVEERMGENNNPKVDDHVDSKSEETFAYEELLELITSFHKTKITLGKCDNCGLI